MAGALKRNKELVHIDLSSTGLTGVMLKNIGTCLRRSMSLCSIHLSDNPGLSEEICDYLVQRIRCRPREDMDRFKRIQDIVNKEPQAQNVQQGVIARMQKLDTFKRLNTEAMRKLIFQR